MWDVRLRRPHPIPHWKEETSFLQFDQVHLLTAHGLIVTGSMDYYDEEEGTIIRLLTAQENATPFILPLPNGLRLELQDIWRSGDGIKLLHSDYRDEDDEMNNKIHVAEVPPPQN